jgi:hypothetical protein
MNSPGDHLLRSFIGQMKLVPLSRQLHPENFFVFNVAQGHERLATRRRCANPPCLPVGAK